MQALVTGLILVAALVHLPPVSGALSAARLEALYGLRLEEPNLLVLMRHRAVLFGIIGCLLIASALHTPLRPVGFVVGLVSMLSFVAIAFQEGGYNAALQRVVLVDVVASAALLAAAVLSLVAGRS